MDSRPFLEDVGRRGGRRASLARISLEDVDPLFKMSKLNHLLQRVSVFQGNASEGCTSSTTSSNVFQGKARVFRLSCVLANHTEARLSFKGVLLVCFSDTLQDSWCRSNQMTKMRTAASQESACNWLGTATADDAVIFNTTRGDGLHGKPVTRPSATRPVPVLEPK